jgi:hypothetical protein
MERVVRKSGLKVRRTGLLKLAMKMRNLSIFLLDRVRRQSQWSLFEIVAFFLFLLLLVGNLSCGKREGKEPKVKINSPPVITSINILPEKPNKESELNLITQSHDPDGDPVTYRYQWMKNDEEIVGENKNTLRSGNFKKGDLIQVRVTPSDGKVDGRPFLSAPVRILNSLPVIEQAWIEPKVAYAKDNLKVKIKSSDKDGDFIYYTYRWEKNRIVMPEERGEVLEKGRFKKGDSITVTVTPDDREAQGPPKKSEPVIISNSPPIITSFPPTSVEGMTYLYQVKADDPDNDPITFTLKSAPKGMEIEKETGLIRWVIRKEDRGVHSIEIEASDNAGAKSLQRYTLTIEFR